MASTLGARLKHAWNAFRENRTESTGNYIDYGQSFMYRPDRLKLTRGPDKTIIASIYNRIAMDVAAVKIQHVQLDSENRYVKTIDSPLNNCLSVEANIDQTGRSLIQDAVLTMLDTGCVALVPTETDIDPTKGDPSFDIITMRAATVQQWYPKYVKVDIYNELTGQHSQYTMPKTMVAIIENPFYPVMNEPNSTMQRLIRKLTLLDAIEEQTGSGKLNMIIQLPYIIRTDEKRRQADNRRAEIERQLTESKYGIAYADGTEKVIQLNKPLESTLLSTIEFLTSMLYSQLGITTGILDGTADEQTMLNYRNRIVEPILSVLADEMKRKFLTKNARTRMHSIEFFVEPFKLVPISNIADIADRFTRNEIMTSNEFRQVIGMKPSTDPGADVLRNKNMPISEQPYAEIQNEPTVEDTANDMSAQLDELEYMLDHSALKHYLPTPSTYASPYYDPEKAHEYYMKNRKLVGRSSTSSLNEEGKAVAQMVKENVYAERDQKIQAHNNSIAERRQKLQDDRSAASKANIEDASSKLESYKNQHASRLEDIKTTSELEREKLSTSRDSRIQAQQKQTQRSIDNLRDLIENMPMDQKERLKSELKSQIDRLREDNNALVSKINEKYASDVTNVQNKAKVDKAQANAEYKEGSALVKETRAKAQEVLKNNYNKSVAELTKESKEGKSKLMEEYTEKWLSELDKLKSIPEYLKPEKGSKSKKKSKKGTGGSGGSGAKMREAIDYKPTKNNSERLRGIKSHARNVRKKL